MTNSEYKISNLSAGSETLLLNDVYLVPPHLAVTVNGKLFTLSVKGPTVEGDLRPLLRMIRQRAIETIFIKLSVPHLFTVHQLNEEIRKYVLAYPRVDVGLATCLAPIRDFCGSVYHAETRNVNFIYDLLPRLEALNVIDTCYHLNLDRYLHKETFLMRKYTMDDINQEIRKAELVITV
jgi:hypothetical protein